MSQKNIRIIIDKDNEPTFETDVNATDRIMIVIDDLGISVRSDGEKLDLVEKSASVEETDLKDFDNQLTLFNTNPWEMNL